MIYQRASHVLVPLPLLWLRLPLPPLDFAFPVFAHVNLSGRRPVSSEVGRASGSVKIANERKYTMSIAGKSVSAVTPCNCEMTLVQRIATDTFPPFQETFPCNRSSCKASGRFREATRMQNPHHDVLRVSACVGFVSQEESAPGCDCVFLVNGCQSMWRAGRTSAGLASYSCSLRPAREPNSNS